jgi:hypothetical protein
LARMRFPCARGRSWYAKVSASAGEPELEPPRGQRVMQWVVSEKSLGQVEGLGEVLPEACRPRSPVHFSRTCQGTRTFTRFLDSDKLRAVERVTGTGPVAVAERTKRFLPGNVPWPGNNRVRGARGIAGRKSAKSMYTTRERAEYRDLGAGKSPRPGNFQGPVFWGSRAAAFCAGNRGPYLAAKEDVGGMKGCRLAGRAAIGKGEFLHYFQRFSRPLFRQRAHRP